MSSSCRASNALTLETLFTEKAKLIIAAADWPEAAHYHAPQTPSAAHLLTPLVFVPSTSHEYVGTLAAPLNASVPDVPENLTANLSLPGPPSGLCVLVALSPAGRQSLETLRDWWNDNAADESPAILCLFENLSDGRSKTHPEWLAHVYGKATELALNSAAASATRCTSLAAQLHELSVDHEKTRAAIAGMQELVYATGRSPFVLAFSLPPGECTFAPDSPAPSILKQLIPLGTEGLAGIDLYSPGARPQSDGELSVSLFCREENQTLATWRFPYRHIARGWLRCGFEKALALPYKNLELVVGWHTLKGPPVPLALSPIGDWVELAACTPERTLHDALSMLLWTAVPAQLLSKPLAHSPGQYSDTSPTRTYRFGSQQFSTIVQTGDCDVHLLSGSTSVRLHPVPRCVTSAVLPNACLCGTTRVTAIVAIQHPEAKSPVEFAMCLTSPHAGNNAFPLDPSSPTHSQLIGTTGWQTIPNDFMPHALVMTIDQPVETTVDLHLATRLPRGSHPDYAWADWLELLVELEAATQSTTAIASPSFRA